MVEDSDGSEVTQADEVDVAPPPFSFKLVLFLGVVYLGWRLFQLLAYLVNLAFS